MKIRIVAASVLVASMSVVAFGDDDPLTAAKSLYQSASYQDALAALSNLPSGANLDEADKYRALCFLGLNRAQDAEHALEQLVTRRPLFKLDPSFDSPKLVATFRDVRAKVLPSVARTLYGTAKSSFDTGKFATASTQFNDLLALLAQPEVADQTAFADLRLLADGFAKLAAQQLKAQAEAPRPAVERPRVDAPAEPRPVAAAQRVFTMDDTNVVPPVTISQNVPNWSPPTNELRTFSGAVDIVIDERGAVVSATINQPVSPLYDRALIAAAKRWQYRPALLSGQPVKYRKSVAVVLRPNAN